MRAPLDNNSDVNVCKSSKGTYGAVTKAEPPPEIKQISVSSSFNPETNSRTRSPARRERTSGMGCPPSTTVKDSRLSPEANFVTASPPESGIRSASASITGIAAFPIPKPNTRPSTFGRYFWTALNGSTASSAAYKIRRRRASRRLWVAKRLRSISVIITETFCGEMMPKPKVFITRAIPEKGFDLIRDFCEVDLWPDELPPGRDDLLQHMRGVDGLLCLLTDKIDGAVMDAAGPQLKVI